MANPGGNYPGGQIFIGTTNANEPAFLYFVSERSEKSQQRYASPFDIVECAIRIKSVDPDEEFDPFRHYHAVRINPMTGLVVISNSQAPVNALYEAYTFMEPARKIVSTMPRDLLQVIGPEYDNKEKPTPRIVGLVFDGTHDVHGNFAIVNSKSSGQSSFPLVVKGHFIVISTYKGPVEFEPSDVTDINHGLFFNETSARGLANELYEMSDYVDPKYGELRVCTVAGVRNGKGPGDWELAAKNRHKPNGLHGSIDGGWE